MADQDPKQPDIDPVAEAPEAPESPEAVAAAESTEADEPTEEEQFAKLQEELTQLRDVALRAQADAQNIQRRAEMDVEKARKFALEGFAKELLPVVDNLERALVSGVEEPQSTALVEGVELTLKSLLDVLKRFKIEPVDPQGEPFDPQLHQAMSMVENPEVEPNTVIAVMQKGYTLNERLVRPAMVMVSK
ncbi:nucleotide exchange factor GrpE [Parahaliea maris]|uniref:Protein GrpE n=1 Tax=Parahaliea maris TaxID=2716870 RepID=A0A5C8ZRZ3_9GAMM|nr:nucleotide exchange factor GrpE [Parahaliea maris]TXS91268.1 nucleotide exchange factor GrpE [Parahaliea maris]